MELTSPVNPAVRVVNATDSELRAELYYRNAGRPVKYATHIVVDTKDGYSFWAGADGNLFTLETATAFARERNREMKFPHRSYALFRLEPEYKNTPHEPGGFLPYTMSEDGKVVYPL